MARTCVPALFIWNLHVNAELIRARPAEHVFVSSDERRREGGGRRVSNVCRRESSVFRLRQNTKIFTLKHCKSSLFPWKRVCFCVCVGGGEGRNPKLTLKKQFPCNPSAACRQSHQYSANYRINGHEFPQLSHPPGPLEPPALGERVQTSRGCPLALRQPPSRPLPSSLTLLFYLYTS